MANFNFQKSALAISSAAALTLLSLASQAQAVNDFGEMLIEGQISTSTCVLSLGDTQSTGAGKKTINLGTYKAADYTATAIGTDIGLAKTTVLRVKGPDGVTDCLLGGSGFWDVGNHHW